jgi:hypothetical protein
MTQTQGSLSSWRHFYLSVPGAGVYGIRGTKCNIKKEKVLCWTINQTHYPFIWSQVPNNWATLALNYCICKFSEVDNPYTSEKSLGCVMLFVLGIVYYDIHVTYRHIQRWTLNINMGNQLTGIAPSQIQPVDQYLTDIQDYQYENRSDSRVHFSPQN